MSKALGYATADCGKVGCNTGAPFIMVGTYEKFQRILLISHPSFVKDSHRQSFPEELMALQTLQKCTSVLGIQSDNEERCSSHAGWRTQTLQCEFEPTSDVNIRPTATFLYLLATRYHELHLLKCRVGAQIHSSALKYRYSGYDLQKRSLSRTTPSIKKRCSVLQKKSWGTET